MKMKRLVATAAAASLAALAFVATASPANAWDLKQCKDTWAKGEDHPDCKKYEKYKPKPPTTVKPATTTTAKPEATTTTVKEEGATTTTAAKATTTTVAVKGEAVKPAPVKVQPKYTG